MIIEEKGTHRIKGKSDTDHNTILTTMNIKNVKEGKTIRRWKLDNKAGWKQLNKKTQQKQQQLRTPKYQELQNIITETMTDTIGEVIINTNIPTTKNHKTHTTTNQTPTKLKPQYRPKWLYCDQGKYTLIWFDLIWFDKGNFRHCGGVIHGWF